MFRGQGVDICILQDIKTLGIGLHQAAVDAPNAAASADVDIVDTAFLQRFAAAYVVLPERIAAIDDDVAGLHQLRQRSEEHTSELQSRSDLVCRLLLEK